MAKAIIAKAVKSSEVSKAQVLMGGDSESLDKPPKTSGKFYTKVREMRNDATVSLCRELVAAPILTAAWSIDSNDAAPPDAKDIIDGCIQPFRLHLLKTSFYGCLDFGWQPYEKVFEHDEMTGKLLPKKLKPLLQDKTDIQIDPSNGSFMGFKQDEILLDLDNSLLVNIDVEGTDWYGQPKMKSVEGAYDNWVICNNANVRYDAKIAGAHWIIHYPKGSTTINGLQKDNFTIATELLGQLQSSGSFVVPKFIEQFVGDANDAAGSDTAWKIELLSAMPTSNVAFIDRLKYLDAMKARGLGLPERAALEGQFGTKAEAEAHADFAISNMELRHQMMVQHYNWHLINQILRLNWGPQYENTVWISVAPITDMALQYIRKIYEAVINNADGFAAESLKLDMDAMRDRLSLPTMSQDAIATVDKQQAQLQGQQVALSLASIVRGIDTNGREFIGGAAWKV